MKPLTRLVDGEDRPLYRLRNTADQTVIREQAISNTIHPNPPNPGPGQEYLPILIDDLPTFDPDFETRQEVEGENKGNWEITYVVAPKPKDEILKSLEEAKRRQVAEVVPGQDFAEITLSVVAALINSAKLTFDPKDQPLVDLLLAQGVKLANNREKLEQYKTTVDGGGKPVIDWDKATVAVAVPAVP